MKVLFATLLISAFFGVAVFGVFAMNHGEHALGGCIAATVNGAPCPDDNNPLASIAFHLNVFKSFSTATFVGFAVGLFLIALALVYSSRALLSSQINSSPKQASFSSFIASSPPSIAEYICHWLALHENSPSVA